MTPQAAHAAGLIDAATLRGYATCLQLQCQQQLLQAMSSAPAHQPSGLHFNQANAHHAVDASLVMPTGPSKPYLQAGQHVIHFTTDHPPSLMHQWLDSLLPVPTSQTAQAQPTQRNFLPEKFLMHDAAVPHASMPGGGLHPPASTARGAQGC